jgi:hypothetical protein
MATTRVPETKYYIDLASVPFLFLFATSTSRKNSEYDAIAALQRESIMHRRMDGAHAFTYQMGEFQPHTSVPETKKTAEENADLKALGTEADFSAIRPGGNQHKRFVLRLGQLGHPFYAPHVYRITDDSPIALPEDIYHFASGPLAREVDPKLIRSSLLRDKNGFVKYDGRHLLELIDSGQLMAHGGEKHRPGIDKFFDIIRRAAKKAGYKNRPIPIFDKISWTLTSMSDPPHMPGEKETPLTIIKENFFYMADGDQRPFPAAQNPFAHSGRYLCTKEQPNLPIIDYWDKYLLEQSGRRMIFDHAMNYVANKSRLEAALAKSDPMAEVRVPCSRKERRHERKKRQIFIVQPVPNDGGPTHITLKDAAGPVEVHRRAAINAQSLIDVIDMKFTSDVMKNGAPVRKNADVVYFPPFDTRDPVATSSCTLAADAALTAAGINPEYKRVILAFSNIYGCYTPILNRHHTAVNRGFSKNHLLTEAYRRNGLRIDVPYVVTDLYVAIGGNDHKAALEALGPIIDARRADNNYARLDLSQVRVHHDIAYGRVKPEGLQANTVFLSACSDNRWLIEAMNSKGVSLAQSSKGLVWGGMDQHAAFYLYDGYRRAKGPWSGAVSMWDLLKSETERNDLPPCDYGVKVRYLAPRTLMLARLGDMGSSYWGGDGTNTEDSAIIAGKKVAPGLIGNWPLTLVDPDFNDPRSPKAMTVIAHYGESAYKRLRGDHEALADQRLFVATSINEDMRRTNQIGRVLEAEAARKRVEIARQEAQAEQERQGTTSVQNKPRRVNRPRYDLGYPNSGIYIPA